MGAAGVSQQRALEEARELTNEIIRLKDTGGMSFNAIAADLTERWKKRIPASRVRRLYYKWRKRKREGKPDHPSANTAQNPEVVGSDPYYHSSLDEVTVLERKFFKLVMDGVPRTQAAAQLGISNPSRWQHETWKRPNFQQYARQILEKNGLTEDYVAKKHFELTNAQRVIYATKDGQITDTMEVPDNQTQMNAVKLAHEVYQRIGHNQAVEQDAQLNAPEFIVLTEVKRKKLERVIGRKIEASEIPGVEFAHEKQASQDPGEEETRQTPEPSAPRPPSASSPEPSAEDPPAE